MLGWVSLYEWTSLWPAFLPQRSVIGDRYIFFPGTGQGTYYVVPPGTLHALVDLLTGM